MIERNILKDFNYCFKSSRGGLEVERLLQKLHDSFLVGLNPAESQKYFRSNSNTTGGPLVNNVQKLKMSGSFT